jgi:[ribosomal protein S5]-alanine N-acetyltransferase
MKDTPVKFLEGVKVYLRPLEKEDVQGNYRRWLNDQEVCLHNSHGVFPVQISELENYVSADYVDRIVLGIFDLHSHEHIGNVSLQQIDWISKSAEFAIIIGEKDYSRGGYGKEASDLILYHGFVRMNLERIYCGTSEDNIAMQKLSNYMSMVKEGVRRKAIFVNGQYRDIYEYGLLKNEYVVSQNYKNKY